MRKLAKDAYCSSRYHVESFELQICSYLGCIADPLPDSVFCEKHRKDRKPTAKVSGQQWNGNGFKHAKGK